MEWVNYEHKSRSTLKTKCRRTISALRIDKSKAIFLNFEVSGSDTKRNPILLLARIFWIM